jgi:beta-glucosidase
MCGGWTLNWASANEEDLDFPTILEVLQNTVDSSVSITYAPTVESLEKILNTTQKFDVCISVVGEEPHSEWLGDSYDLAIEPEEQHLLEKAKEVGIPLVVVSLIGRPQNITWMAENVDAILWAYLPGSEGSKPIVDVLFGQQNPSGKLPMTFPKDANQIPILYNARRYFSYEIQTKYEPLYPFGYGLSYTTFSYRDLQVPTMAELGQDVTISVSVKNTGNMKGTEVVQVYLADVYASVTRPIKSLKAFQRVALEPDEEKQVELTLTPDELSLFNEYLEFVEEPREIDITISGLTQRIKIG